MLKLMFAMLAIVSLSAFQVPSSPTAQIGQQLPDAILQLQEDFADYLGVEAEEVLIDDYDSLTWTDSCFGAGLPHESCLVTPIEGYAVLFNTSWGEFTFHLDSEGEAFRLVAPLILLNNEYPALLWQRLGDPAPACFRLIRASDNRYVLLDCLEEEPVIVSEGMLEETDEEEAERLEFYATYAPVHWVTAPPAPMTELYLDTYVFNGQGEELLDDQQQADLNAVQVELMAYLIEHPSTPTPTGDTSGIEGYVTIGPMCPVQTQDSPCPDAPYVATITIFDNQGKVVASVVSDATGYFQVSLEAGTYTLHPESPDGFTQASEQVVKVVAGELTRADISYDSGIR